VSSKSTGTPRVQAAPNSRESGHSHPATRLPITPWKRAPVTTKDLSLSQASPLSRTKVNAFAWASVPE
jgi:hypothetical protein